MAVSQFTYYASTDVGAPVLSGSVGSLLTVLDACLVNGYGSKAAAGWTKPIANAGNIGVYKQGAGSMLTLLVNDNAPNVTAGAKEAWVTGWESVATIAAPVGTGTGQFPTPAQLLTTGHGVVRKSSAASTAARAWFLYADSMTMYLFVYTEDGSPTYPLGKASFVFGDFYAYGPNDTHRCLIIARVEENTTGPVGDAGGLTQQRSGVVAKHGHFIARAYNGTGTSTPFSTNACFLTPVVSIGDIWWNHGLCPCPNPVDGKIRLSSIYVVETTGGIGYVRGVLRGAYAWLHTKTSLPDMYAIEGTGPYAGKSFMGINNVMGYNNNNSWDYTGPCLIETSNTVDTN